MRNRIVARRPPPVSTEPGATYSTLSAAELDDPSCIMWAILALAGLYRDLGMWDPQHYESAEYAEALLAARLCLPASMIGNPSLPAGLVYEVMDMNERFGIVNRLCYGAENYHDSFSTPSDVMVESSYLAYLYGCLHHHIYGQLTTTCADGVYNGLKMGIAVGEVMRELLDGIVRPVNATLQEIAADAMEDPNDTLNAHVNEVVEEICSVIENYIRAKTNVQSFEDEIPAYSIGDRMVELVQVDDVLKDHVNDALFAFLIETRGKFTTLRANVEGIVLTSMHANVEVEQQMEAAFDVLYRRIGSIFTAEYATESPLINAWVAGPMLDDIPDDVPDHIVNHEFDQYEDNDWSRGELELVDVQDVLLGPAADSVILNDISTGFEFESAGEACNLCADTNVPMRELKACGHEICAGCLNTQIQANHECRYKCPFCRAEFFSESAGMWQVVDCNEGLVTFILDENPVV